MNCVVFDDKLIVEWSDEEKELIANAVMSYRTNLYQTEIKDLRNLMFKHQFELDLRTIKIIKLGLLYLHGDIINFLKQPDKFNLYDIYKATNYKEMLNKMFKQFEDAIKVLENNPPREETDLLEIKEEITKIVTEKLKENQNIKEEVIKEYLESINLLTKQIYLKLELEGV